MSYYHSKVLKDISFEQAIEKATEALKTEGFGILTEIDIQATLKKKLDEDFHPYMILGACNPPFALQALKTENKIGTMLPCNVIVQQTEVGVEVAAVDPISSMQGVENLELGKVAKEVQAKLFAAIDAIE